jgi:citrate lyase beta subunit
MTSKRTPDEEPAQAEFVNKMFRLRPDAAQAFEILKAKQGPRSGPRLAAEMVDLLLVKHGEKPVGPLRPGAASKREGHKPK